MSAFCSIATAVISRAEPWIRTDAHHEQFDNPQSRAALDVPAERDLLIRYWLICICIKFIPYSPMGSWSRFGLRMRSISVFCSCRSMWYISEGLKCREFAKIEVCIMAEISRSRWIVKRNKWSSQTFARLFDGFTFRKYRKTFCKTEFCPEDHFDCHHPCLVVDLQTCWH